MASDYDCTKKPGGLLLLLFLVCGFLANSDARPWPPKRGACRPCRCFIETSRHGRDLRGRTADCSDLQLTDIPPNLPTNLDNLLMKSNHLTELNPLSLTRYMNLKSLCLANNSLTSLSNETFLALPFLNHLSLADNDLDFISPGALQLAPKLKTIHGLQVKTLNVETFKHLMRLRHLSITTSDIPGDIFDGLFINDLSLHLTSAGPIAEHILQPLNTTLMEFHLVAEELLEIGPAIFHGLILLQKIYIEAPKMSTLPRELLYRDPVLNIDADQSSPDEDAWNTFIPTDETKIMKDITFVGIKEIPANIFHQSSYLEKLKIEGAAVLPSEVFKNLQRLNELNLSSNNLTVLYSTWVKDLGGLNIFNLSHNSLTDIGPQLHSLHSLQNLDLSHNSLTSLSKKALLSFQTSLERLDLSWNEICHIESDAFNSMWSLECLDLGHNCLSQVLPDDFIDLQKLTDLHLESNQLQELSAYTLGGMHEMQTLDVSHNAIQSVDPDLFNNGATLREINFSYNDIPEIPYELFENQFWLKKVNFEGNPNLQCGCGMMQLIRLHSTVGTAVRGDCIYEGVNDTLRIIDLDDYLECAVEMTSYSATSIPASTQDMTTPSSDLITSTPMAKETPTGWPMTSSNPNLISSDFKTTTKVETSTPVTAKVTLKPSKVKLIPLEVAQAISKPGKLPASGKGRRKDHIKKKANRKDSRRPDDGSSKMGGAGDDWVDIDEPRSAKAPGLQKDSRGPRLRTDLTLIYYVIGGMLVTGMVSAAVVGIISLWRPTRQGVYVVNKK